MAGWCTGEYGCNGTLTVGVSDFPLNCPAWDVVNLAPLWFEHQIRGDNLRLPRINGTRGRPRRFDEAQHNLVLWIRGDADKDGVATTDGLWQGIYDNLAAIQTNVTDPIGTGEGTRPCTLTLPDGITELTADVQFEPMVATGDITDPMNFVVTLPMIIPAGRFA